jgi:DNA-directed RNA polymerase specialized sigma24 family protein
MDAPPWKGSQDQAEAYPDDSVRASYVQITKACLCAGLSPADAEDLAQDIWEWVIRTGVPIALIASPWLKAVVHNYILRFRRRTSCHHFREGQLLEKAPEPQSSHPLPVLESNELLDRVASVLPKRERNLLALIRQGFSFTEAARILAIPRGSHAYHQGQLIAYARREMKRRNVRDRANHQAP